MAAELSTTSARLQAWAQMTAAMGRCLDAPSAMLDILADGVRCVLDAQFSTVLTTVDPGGVVELRVAAGIGARPRPIIEKVWGCELIGARITLVRGDPGPLSQAFFEQHDTFVAGWPEAITNYPRAEVIWKTLQEALDVRSLWSLPLAIEPDGECLGLLVLGRASPEPPTAEDRLFAKAFLAQAALALRSAQLHAADRERTAYLEVLYQMSRRIAAVLEPDEVMQVTVREIVERFPYAVAALLAVDHTRSELELRAIAGLRAAQVPEHFRQSINTGIVGFVARTGQTYVSNSVQSDPYFDGVPDLQTGAELAVPLKREGRVIGVLNLEKPAGERFDQAEIMAMETVTGQAAVALENAELYAELHEYVRRIEESQRRLIQAEKLAALGRLVGSIAHEVNNPLQAIQNCLHLAFHSSLPEEKRRAYHQMAAEEVEHLIETVRRMLEFYRPTSADFVPTDLNSLLDDVLALAEKQLADHRIKVKKKYRRNMPRVPVAGSGLKQVFLNLLLNASEAMPDGGQLTLRTGVSRSGRQSRALAAFSDTGSGIPPEAQEKLFEPFFTTKERGTGLGLAVCYSIVEAHGGWIRVDSTPGAGTTFTVYLPLAREQRPQA